MKAIAVLGAGSWGTALAVHLTRIGHDVTLWARDEALVAEMRARRANATYLPDVAFPPRVSGEHRRIRHAVSATPRVTPSSAMAVSA